MTSQVTAAASGSPEQAWTKTMEDLFSNALRVPMGAERDAWIKSACKGDAEGEAKLRALLATHHALDPTFLDPSFDPPDQAE